MDRHLFFKSFNEALMKGDTSFILKSVSDNVSWKMIGSDTIKGKEALSHVLGNMDHTSEYNLIIDHIVTDGEKAAVEGIIEITTKLNELMTYGFCDIYKLDENEQIKEITSYVIIK